MKLLNFEVWFYIHLTNTKKIITDFQAYFMGVLSLQGGKDPPRNS